MTFTLPSAIWADSVHLVGDFNCWDTSATPLRRDETSWSVALDLESDTSYQYRYLINGAEWQNDCNADSYVRDEHGTSRSVLMTIT